MEITKITFQNPQGWPIVATLSCPSKQGLFPGVILCHGFKGNRNDLQIKKTADRLTSKGFIALRFDFTNNAGASYGRFENLTISQELADLEAAFKFILSLTNINPRKIGLMGTSLGGFIAATYTSINKQIRSLALLSSVFNVEAMAYKQLGKEQFLNWKHRGRGKVFSYSLNTHFYIKYNFMEDLNKYNSSFIAKKITCPLLTIHGDSDQSVGADDSNQWLKLSRSAKKKSAIIHNADHMYSRNHALKQATILITDWFKETLS